MPLTAATEGLESVRAPGVVRAQGLVYRYGSSPPVLDGLDIDVGVGEIVALVGPRGSGKSTLLRILAGDLTPEAGVLEVPPLHSGGGRAMLGYAGDVAPHFESLSGRRNALFFAMAAGLKREDAEAAVAEYMGLLGLKDQAMQPVAEYSFASRRRLLLVEALAHRPALTLLDEPFLGLERASREALIHLLRVHAAKRGSAVVASHELSLLPELADRILFLHDGRIAKGGRVAELFASVGPATRIEIELERRPQLMEARYRPGIRVVSDGETVVLESTRGQVAVGEACAALIAAGAVIRSVRVRETDLAEVFRRVTGTELQP